MTLANNNETTTKFKVDISELKKGMQEAARQIRLANSEFKAATSGLDDWSKSADGVGAKITQLNSVLDAQKDQLKNLEKQYELTAKEQGESSKGAQELMIKINNQKAAIGNTEKQIRNYTQKLQDLESASEAVADEQTEMKSAMDKLKNTISKQESELKDLKKQYTNVVLEQGKNSKAAKELASKIDSLSSELTDNKRKLSDAEYATEDLADAQEDARTTFEKLADTISDQESELEKLKRQYSNTVLEQGESSDAARDLANQIDSLSSELNDNRRQLSNAEDAADDFDNTLDDVDDATKNATDGFTVMKGALADLVASGIKAAVQGLKDLTSAAKEAYNEFDEGYDNLIKATGATGDTAKDLEKSYKNVAKSVKGEFNDIGSAVGEVNTRFGYTGEQLEETTVAFMKFADITGTDATEAVKLVSRAMGDAGIDSSEYAAVLDDLAIAAQASGISVDKLTELLTKYGAPMRALGFETKDAIAIFSQWEKAGVNTEIAFSGMKTAISKWSKEGKDAKVEFRKTLDEIAATPDIASATTKAIEAFGQKAGPDLADAIKGGRFEYSDFLSVLENSNGTVEKTYEQTQDGFDKIKLAAQGLKADVGDAFKNMMDEYGPEIEKTLDKIKNVLDKAFKTFTEKIMPKVIEGFQWISDHSAEIEAAIAAIGAAFIAFKAVTFVQTAITAFKTLATVIQTVGVKQAALNAIMVANPIGLVVAGITGLVAAFVVLWNKSEKFRNFWKGLWESIQETVGKAVEKIKEIWNVIKDFFSGLWNGIKEKASVVWDAIIGFFTNAGEKIINAWTAIKDFFIGIWDGIKSVFSTIAKWTNDHVYKPIINFFKPVIDFFKSAFEIIFQLAEGCWNLIKFVWSLVKDWFNENVITPVKDFFIEMWNAISSAASATWEFIKEVWTVVSVWFNENIIEPVKNFFVKMWDSIKDGASNSWNGIKKIWNVVSTWFNNTIIKPIKDFFSGMWDKLKSGAKDAWNGIKSVFGSVAEWFENKFRTAWQKVKDVFSTGGKIFDGIKEGITDAFKTVVNAIIRGINKVIAIPFNAINNALDKIRNVSIAGVEPFSGLISRFDVPQIPELAKGGIVSNRTFIAGEDGEEAIVPLEKNQGGLKKIAQLLASYMPHTEGLSLDKLIEVIRSEFENVTNAIKSIELPKIDLSKITDIIKNILMEILNAIKNVPKPDKPEFPKPDKHDKPEFPTIDLSEIIDAIKSIEFPKIDLGPINVEINKIADLVKNIKLPDFEDNWLSDVANCLNDKINISSQPVQQTINNNTTNNFNQTNNSPKSLSRLEIYRQSKNLLRMKGVR